MLLELTSDQEFFRETTAKFLGAECPVAELRAKRDDPAGFDPSYWRQGAELGWTSLLVSEADGGGSISGEGVVDLTLIGFEFGRHAAPGPLTAASVVAAALSMIGSDDHKREVLGGLLSGDQIASWCLAEPVPNDALGAVALDIAQRGSEVVLNGIKAPVESAGQADHFLVTGRTGQGLTQVLVPADAPGVTVRPMHTVDLTRRFGEVTFTDVALPGSALVGTAGEAADQVERQLQFALVTQAAETVGAMDRAFEMTVEWAFNRYSFGRPLASYQELKHRFADMKSWLEASHAIADSSARAVQQQTPRAAELVSVAKSYIGEYGTELIHDCVQIHGGIGVTFEHDLHLFLRRATLNQALCGTVSEHRQRITRILEQGAAA
jgi:alkylation response protein AidB-like acyl-CoA dehydrogenase